MPLKDLNTSATLLREMRRREQVAWQSFMIRYCNFLRRNCVRFGVTESLVEDVIQDVAIKILDGILSFERRGLGSFRAWMKAIIRNCWVDRLRREKHGQIKMASQAELEVCAATQECEIDQMIQEEFVQMCYERVQQKTLDHYWEVYRLSQIEGFSLAETASRLNMPLHTVHIARFRVARLLQEEISKEWLDDL